MKTTKLLLFLTLSLSGFSCQVVGKGISSDNKVQSVRNPPIKKVLILGNSITFHSKDASLGWSGNWGMAASARDKDYVHLLRADMQKYNPTVDVYARNIVSVYEKKFWQFDTADFEANKAYMPDMIILTIGENIQDPLAVKYPLGESIEKLINFLKGDRDIPVCLVGSFWYSKYVTNIIKETAQKNGWIYVSLDGLFDDQSNNALKSFSNRGVGRHPSDDGMKQIESRIWSGVKPFFGK